MTAIEMSAASGNWTGVDGVTSRGKEREHFPVTSLLRFFATGADKPRLTMPRRSTRCSAVIVCAS